MFQIVRVCGQEDGQHHRQRVSHFRWDGSWSAGHSYSELCNESYDWPGEGCEAPIIRPDTLFYMLHCYSHMVVFHSMSQLCLVRSADRI